MNSIGIMIFEKSLKCLVKSDLEGVRSHIEWKQADVFARRKEGVEEKLAVLSVLSQINHIIERFDSDDTEENLVEQYNKLRQRILERYEVINTKPENNNINNFISKKLNSIFK